jgi:hypothetical protein
LPKSDSERVTNLFSLDHKQTYWGPKKPGKSPSTKSNSWVRGFFVLVLLLLSLSISAQITTIWLEDFSGVPDTETIDDGSYTPLNTAWSVDNSACTINGGDYSWIISNEFRAGDNDGEAVWTNTGTIDISGYSNANITVDLFENGNNSGDYVEVYYRLDGGPEIQLTNGNQTGNFTSVVASVYGLSGSTLQIVVRINHSSGNKENYFGFDNIHVFYEPAERYAINNNGFWNSGSTWSYTEDGPNCNCIPNAGSEVYTDGRNVIIDGDADAKDLTVDGGDITFNGSHMLTIHNNGTLLINSGSSIDIGVTSGELTFDNGTTFNLAVNDATTGLEIEEIYHDADAILTISGNGRVVVRDDITLRGDNSTIINNLGTTLTLDGTNLGGSPSNIVYNGTNNTFRNNTSISIFDGMWGGTSNSIFSNYGTVTQYGDFNNFGNLYIYNYSGAIWNWSGNDDDDVSLYANIDGANDFNYTLNGDQDIITPQDAYWHLNLYGSGTKQMQASFEVEGNLDIGEPTVILDINGQQLNIAGNCSNNGSSDLATGTIEFDGTGDQGISNNGGEEFSDIIINKPSGTLYLDDEVEVNNSIDFMQGLVNTNDHTLYLSNGTMPASWSYTSGQIIGRFERQITSTTPDYEFPVGTVTTENMFTVKTNSGLTSGSLVVWFTDSDPGGTGLPVTDGAQSVYHQFSEGYWSAQGNNSFACTNYNVELNANGFTSYTVGTATRVITRPNGSNWDDPVPGAHTGDASTTVYRNNITTRNLNIATAVEFGCGHPTCITTSIVTDPTSLTDQCLGSDILFGIEASGGGTLNYDWWKVGSPDTEVNDGGDISGAETDTLRIANIDATDAGSYYCVVDNICSSPATSATASLSIDDDVPVPTCAVAGDQAVGTNTGCTYVHPDNTWDGSATDNCSAPGNITITYNLYTATTATGLTTLNGQAFNQGTTWVRMIAVDEASNVDSCSFTVTVSDDDAPVPTCAVGNQTVGTNTGCTYVHSDNSWDGSATDNCSAAGNITITYNLYSATTATGLTTLNGQTFNQGVTWVRMIATDEAANVDSCSFTVTVNDDDVPVPACAVSGNQAVTTNTGCTYVHPDNTWDGSATDNCSAPGNITITYNLYTATTATGLTTLNGQAFNQGVTWVRMIATDEAANVDSCSFTVTVTDDDVPVPTCAVAGDQAVGTNTGCTYVHPDNTWDGSATDNCSAPGNITITYNLYTATTATGLTTLNGQAFNQGTTWVRMIAVDEASNVDSCSFTVTVSDDDAPVPTCAVGNQTVGTNTGCTYVHSDNSWDGSATDNCSAAGNITITYNLYSATTATGLTTLNGQTFNQGVTWVRMIATDEAANVDSCSFTVTVNDDDVPVPACAVSGNQAVTTNTGCTYVHPDNTWDGSATDNCSAPGNITITYNLYTATTATGLTTLNGQAFNQGVTWVRMIATDEAANVDSCSFTVTVTDDDVPVPTCAVAGDQAVGTNTGCTYVHPDNTWDGSATDNCSAPGNITITYNLYTATTATGLTTLNGQAFNQGTTWVRMIAVDEASNVDSCSFTVTVSDDDAPVPTCAVGNQTVGTNTGCTYVHSDNSWDGSATDNCSAAGNITITYNLYSATTATGLTTLNGQTFNQGVTWVRMIATDEAANVDSCSFTVTVNDDDVPVPACAVSGNQAVTTNTGCTYVHPDNTWDGSATDNCSAPGNITITYNLYTATTATGLTTLNGQAFNQGVTWVRMIATDEAANVDSCSFTVTVTDDDVPVPTCAVAGDQAVGTNTGCTYVHPDNTWDGSATDNCSAPGNITITYNLYTATTATGLTTLNGQAFNQGTTWVRMIAVDEASNVDSCSFTVTVSDDDAPVPTCAVGNQTVGTNTGCTYVHSDNSWDGSATDNCSAAGNITITYNLYSATTATGLTTLNGQTFNQGVTWVRMIATDEAANVDSCSFTVTVNDDDVPVPACAVSGNQAVTTNTGCTYVHPDNTWDGSATDNCSAPGNITITYNLYTATTATGLTTLNGQAFNQGVTWVRMIATDEAANVDSCSFTVTVTDDDVPVPTCAVAGDQAVGTNTGCTYVHPDNTWDGSATDNCSAPGNITITYNLYTATTATGLTTLNGQAFNQGTTWVRMIAVDEASNVDSCSFTVTVSDDDAPVPTCAVGNQTVGTNTGCTYVHSDNSWDGSATDNCSAAGNITITYNLYSATTATGLTTLNGQTFNQGVTWVRMIATDEAANVDSCSFTVTVNDDDVPVPACAVSGNQAVTTNTGCTYVHPDNTWDGSATDNCSAPGNITITYNLYTATTATGLTTLNGQAFNQGVTWVRMIATDEAANVDSCSFTVTVTDDDVPVPTCAVAGDQAVGTNTGCTYVHPDNTWDGSATDNCSAPGNITITYNLYTATTATGLTTLNGQAFNQGVTWVRMIATDAAANVDSCSFTVTVSDDDNPIANAYPTLNLQISLATGIVVIDTIDIDNGSTDNCGIVSRSIDIDTFYCDDIGNVIPVTLIVWDASGNFSTDVTSVTITGYDIEPAIATVRVSDTNLCSGDRAEISLVSNADSTSYNWTITAHPDVTGDINNSSVNYPPGGDYTLNPQFFNSSDTARRVQIDITSTLFNLCAQTQFDTTFYFWVIPGLSVDLEPNADTICNNDTLDITIGSPSVFEGLRFRYEIIPDDPGSLEVIYRGDTSGLLKGHIIVDSLVNSSGIPQRAVLTATPYISGPGAGGSCSPTPDNTIIWVEPTISIAAVGDTICSDGFTNINIISTGGIPTRGIRYTWTVTDLSGGDITGWSDSLGIGQPIDKPIVQQLTNAWDDSTGVIYTITPYTIQADSSLQCAGESIDIKIIVNPEPKINVVSDVDTLCDNSTVTFNISTPNTWFSGNWVYDVDTTASNPGSVTGHTSGRNLTGNYIKTLTNLSDTVQWVDFTFHPKINNPTATIDSCDAGAAHDTTIRIWINPTPRIQVEVDPIIDTLLCDSASVTFNIDSLIAGTTGQWVYDIDTVSSAPGLLNGYRAGIGFTGDFTDQLINLTNSVQWVDYTFHPRINNPRSGLAECDNGTAWDTTIRIWVEPYPGLTLNPVNDTICSGDTTALQINSLTSSYYPVEFEYFTLPVNPAEVSVTNVSPTTRLTNGEYIVDDLVNLSDTAQVVNYKVVPYTVVGNGTKQCTGDTVFAEVIVEPALIATLIPDSDTICSEEPVNIKITSTSKSSQPLRFFYNIYPENPTEIDILYDTAFGTIALDTGRFIVDTLVNISDTAQLVRFDVTAYVQSGSDQGCPGVTTSAFVWVEPTPKVVPVPLIDTICDSTQTSIVLTSPTGSTRPVEFEYIIEPENAGDVVITPAPAVGLQKLDTIQHYIDNTSDTAQLVQFRIIPYTIDAAGFRHCDGDTVTADVWVEPTPVVSLQPVIDTICDSTEVEIVLTSPTGATRPVEFEYILEPENAGDVIIHPAVGTNGLQKLDTISHYIDNTSDTAQLVRFRVIPYTIDGFGFRRCDGDTVTTDVWVEPTPIAITQPLADTLCDSTEVRLVLTGPTGPTRPVLYEYSIVNSYPAEIVITPGAGAGGLSKYDTISHYIDNTGDTARLVQFIVTPYTIDASGARHCDGPSSTTDVWVEPTPALTLNPVNDTLCSGDTTAIQISSISSPIYDVEFEYFTLPVNPAEVTVTNVSPTTRLTNGEYIVDQLVNLSDTAQVINYKVVPYTIDGAGNKRCTGDTVFAEVVLEPALVAILTPMIDTICSEEPVNIKITSTSKSSQPLRFFYNIYPENPTEIDILYDTAFGTIALDTGRFIVDTLVNISDTAQLVRFDVTAYVQSGSDQGCPGVTTSAFVWVEPTPKVVPVPLIDTICDSTQTSIVLTSPTGSTRPVEFEYIIEPENAGDVVITPAPAVGLQKLDTIQHYIDNTSDTAQLVQFRIIPYTIDAAGFRHCDGDTVTADVWVEPTPVVNLQPVIDTICDSTEVEIVLTSPTGATRPVEFEYILEPENAGDVIIHPAVGTNGLQKLDTISHYIDNTSDTAQLVRFRVIPYTIDGFGFRRCDGDTVTTDVWVEPTPIAITQPLADTLCDSTEVRLVLTGPTGPTRPVLYEYSIVNTYPAEIVITPGAGAGGLSKYDTISHYIDNTGDTARLVQFIVTPYTIDAGGARHCDGPSSTTDVWVEPTPALTLNPVNDTLCSGDTTAIQISSISSPIYDVEFEYFTLPVNPAEVTVTNVSPTTRLTNGEYIVDQLVNLSDTAQVINYKVVPYTIDGAGTKRCTGDTVFAEVVLEPALVAILTPIADTLCNEQPMSIRITSTSRTSQPLRFRYTIEPANPGSVIVGYDTTYGTVALDTGRFIVDTLTNITDEAQLVRVTVTPYVQGAAEQGCPGVPTVAEIWVEPTIDITASSDTLCTEDFTNIVVSSTRVPTKGIRYTWTVSDISGGVVTGWSNSTGNGYPITRHLQQQLVNSSSDSASIVYTITPHAIRGDSSLRCAGIPIDVRVWVNPTPDIYVEAAPDTILCDSGLVTFTIDSLSLFGFAGDWVYTVNSVPSSGDISGYTNNAELTDGFTDELVNLSDTVQWVDYTFHPQILNSYSEIPYCGNTTVNDTTIRIYVNPTPRLFVNVTPDTLLCDSSFVSFEIDSLIRGTTGQWVYDIDTVSSAPGLLQGYTAGTDFTGNFSDQLINLTDTVQWVEYTFHPRINNPRTGLAECDNGTAWDTTIRIWVEPTPRLTLNPVNDTICSGDTTAIQISSISSPFYEVEFEYFTAPVNPAEVTVTNISSTTGLTNGEYIVDQLVNLSDTAQVVNYKVVPYTVDRLGVKHCTGDTVFAEVVVEPVLNAILTPIADTLCNEQPMSIRITSTSRTSQPLRFRYTVEPENPGSVIVGYDTIYGTVALDTGRFIVDTLTNITDEAQLVRVTVTPYVQGAAEQGCPGVPTVAEIWVEPTIDIAAESDTLCTEDFTNIVVSSTRVPTKGIRYTWTVSDISGGVVTGWSNSTGNGYPITRNLQQQLVNSSSDSASIVYTITPHAIRGDSSLRCAGIPI